MKGERVANKPAFSTRLHHKTSCEVFRNNNSAKSDSRATTEAPLVSRLQKAAFSESISNVVFDSS